MRISGEWKKKRRNVLTLFSPQGPDSSKKEIYASWAIFILIMLLIVAFFTSYTLQRMKITAVHETVVSIFAGGWSPDVLPFIPAAARKLISLSLSHRHDGRAHPAHERP